MIFYIILLAIILIAVACEYTDRLTSWAVSLLFLVFAIFMYGFRWETGIDWLAYLNYFQTRSFANFELGYATFTKIVSAITSNFTVYLTLQAIGSFIPIYFFARRNIDLPTFGFVIFFLFLFPFMGANRQFIAFGLGCLAIDSYRREAYFGSLVWILAAVLFHQTAVFFAAIYFSRLFPMSNRTVVVSLFVIVFLRIMFASIVHILSSLNLPTMISLRIGVYTTGGFSFSDIHFLLGVARKLIPLVGILMFRKGKEADFYLYLYIFAVAFYIIPYGFAQVLVERLTLYFEVFGYIGLVVVLGQRARGWQRVYGMAVILMLVSIHMYLQLYDNNIYLFPYKGIFINDSFVRSHVS